MKIRPLSDRVIVKRLEEERKTASGVVIPDAATEKPDQGEIIAVGNGKVGDDGKVRAMSVKVGDKVLFGKKGTAPPSLVSRNAPARRGSRSSSSFGARSPGSARRTSSSTWIPSMICLFTSPRAPRLKNRRFSPPVEEKNFQEFS